MNGLSQFLVESILMEAADITKIICVYSGRFQPFHKGHYATYQNLCKKFGSDNVYIATSNVTDNNKSPFDFKDKKAIMTKMFGIPSNKIVQVKNPYAPNEVLDKYNANTTAVVSAVGEKDEMRLGGKYFRPYKDGKIDTGYKDAGYVYAAPAVSNPISGTDVRNWLSKGSEADKKKNFMKAYPKFDEQIFKLITLKLSKFAKEGIYESIQITELNDKYAYKPLSEFGFGTGAAGAGAPAAGGFPGGIGTGLNLPSGYINGAPTGKETNKLSKKLRKKTGLAGYEPVEEALDSDYTKVKCSKCGWEWFYKDGGNDPYVCHKCGHDNSAIYETIKKVGDNEWAVYPKKGGDRLGTHKSYASALRQLKAIEIHKHEGVEDRIPGGLAKGKTLIDLAKRWDKKGYYEPTQFAKEYIKPQLLKGIKVEMEHTTDAHIATEIAMDHLWEDLHYYEKLATIEKEALAVGGQFNHNSISDMALKYKVDPSDIKNQIYRGAQRELENMSDVRQAVEIAKNNISRDYNYYDEFNDRGPIEAPIDENKVITEDSDTGGGSMSDIGISPFGGKNKVTNDATSQADSANSTTGAEHNKTWKEFDKQEYYTAKLPGWEVHSHTSTDTKAFPKSVIDRQLPIFNHGGDEGGTPDHLKQSITPPNEQLYESVSVRDLEKVRMALFIKALKMMPNSPAQMKVRADIDKLNKQIEKLQKENINEISGFDYANADGINSEHNANWKEFRDKKKYIGDLKGWKMVKHESDHFKDIEHLTLPIFNHSDENGQMDHTLPNRKVVNPNKFLKKVQTKSSIPVIKEGLITEGGAYGHMNHPFDLSMNLTFGDLKTIVKKALNGELEAAREKTDGQALAISWVNGRLVAARNKSHLKNKGAGAMTIGQVASNFAGRGALTDAYTFAMNDLNKAISALSEAQKKKIFQDGKSFMNLEVIYPQNANVIPYGQPLLVFHGTFEYDDAGNVIGENQEAAKILAGMIKQVNQHVQSTYTIQGPPVQTLPKSQDLSSKQGKYLGMISKLQSEFGLTDKNGVADYHQAWWTNFVDKNAKKLDPQQKIGLIKRWAFGDKSFRIADIKDAKIKAWADGIDKKDQNKISKDNLIKFEEIFLGVGAEVLSFMSSVLTANPDAAKKKLVSDLQNAVSDIRATGDAKKIEKLELELSRMDALGGFDKIVPNEGLVFTYKGNTYKLTGAFAPLNQILGIFKFGR